MKYLFSSLVIILSLSTYAQSDSLTLEEEYPIDTIIVMDTTFVIDTIITADTSYIRMNSELTDTLLLDSFDQSWSLIPQDTIPKSIDVRQDSGIMLLSAKIGFSDQSNTKNWDGYSINSIPPLAVQLDYFQNNYISWGGQVLYSRNKYTNDTLATTYFKDNTFGITAIGSFHYGSWLQDISNNWFTLNYLDLYVSMAVRMDIHRYVEGGVWSETLQQYEADNTTKDNEVKMRIRPIFGARYYISDRFSINLEVGKGNLGMLTSSVSWIISKP